jgi:hypothetical protein
LSFAATVEYLLAFQYKSWRKRVIVVWALSVAICG